MKQKITAVRALRASKGRPLREISRRTGIDTAQLTRIELGQGNASIKNLHKIASAVGDARLAETLEPFAADAIVRTGRK